MCLICRFGEMSFEDKEKLFIFTTKEGEKLYYTAYLHMHDNRMITLTKEHIDEIIANALQVIMTGIDLTGSIWAIQWPNDYKVVNDFT